MTRFTRIASAALGTFFLAYGAVPGLADDDDDDDLTFEQRIITSILGGLGTQPGGGIRYRERSPLVVPATRDLPPPDTTSAIDRSPAWPKDPDERRKVVKKKKQDRPKTVRETQFAYDPGTVLLPSELDAPGRAPPGTGRVTRAGESINDAETGRPLPPSALGYVGGVFGSLFSKSNDETVVFNGEPPRTSLTEPPPGYQTPSPNHPYGVRPDQSRWFKIPTFFDRGVQPTN